MTGLLATVVIIGLFLVSGVFVLCWERREERHEAIARSWSGEEIRRARDAAVRAEQRAQASTDAHLARVEACANCPGCIATLDYMPEIGDLPE